MVIFLKGGLKSFRGTIAKLGDCSRDVGVVA